MNSIETHFNMLMPLAEQERIGATKDKGDSMRVLRLLDHYEQMRAAATQLYMSAHWTTEGVSLAEQIDRWERLRVALGIEHGEAPKPTKQQT